MPLILTYCKYACPLFSSSINLGMTGTLSKICSSSSIRAVRAHIYDGHLGLTKTFVASIFRILLYTGSKTPLEHLRLVEVGGDR